MQKQRYWLYQRNEVFYLHDSETGKRESLHTHCRRKAEQARLVRNQAAENPRAGLALAKAILSAHDPCMAGRTWQTVFDEFSSRGKAQTQADRRRVLSGKKFNPIRQRKLIETTGDDFGQLLKAGGAQLHHYLRCLQNLAVGLGWLPWPVLPPKLWPPLNRRTKRAITSDEHLKILAAEPKAQRRLFYQLLWETGASQSDGALLSTENINWEDRVLSYQRKKTGEWACLRIGQQLESLLRQLPPIGRLFPEIATQLNSTRSADFFHRCRALKIVGVSLHSYRYAWAERARSCGYPERWAQNALGHNSRAVHQAYAKRSIAVCPALDEYATTGPTKAAA